MTLVGKNTVLQVISWRLCRHAAYQRHNKMQRTLKDS